MKAVPVATPPRLLDRGDMAPWLRMQIQGLPQPSELAKLGGRHVLLLFLGSAGEPRSAEALRRLLEEEEPAPADDRVILAVTIDPTDVTGGRLRPSPILRYCLDFDRSVSRSFRAAYATAEGLRYRPHWLLLDPTLRVLGRWDLPEGEQAMAALRAAMASSWHMPAPVLIVPNVIEPAFARELIGLYDRHGGGESGFMRQVGDKTVPIYDDRHKRRRDHIIADEAIRQRLRHRLQGRLIPMIERGYQFRVTRIERYIVACYDAAEGGHFAAHRDNTTSATAHRRFAVSINLNDDYEGGDLTFPEFGPQPYRAPAGGAVVFSCSLLHAAGKVTAGRRYATLPFLYDDAAAAIREANAGTLQEG